MATKVYLSGTWDFGKKSYVFRSLDGYDSLWVEAYVGGIAVVTPGVNESVDGFAALIAGCFEEGSNFEEELCKAFKCDYPLEAIQYDFNRAVGMVTKRNANKDRIAEEIIAGMREL